MLDHILKQHQELRKSISSSIDSLISSDEDFAKCVNDYFEKGGRGAVIGETRTFGGREYIKTANGWKFHGKGTGKKATEHRNAALGHHVDNAKNQNEQASAENKAPNKEKEIKERLRQNPPLAEKKRLHSELDSIKEQSNQKPDKDVEDISNKYTKEQLAIPKDDKKEESTSKDLDLKDISSQIYSIIQDQKYPQYYDHHQKQGMKLKKDEKGNMSISLPRLVNSDQGKAREKRIDDLLAKHGLKKVRHETQAQNRTFDDYKVVKIGETKQNDSDIQKKNLSRYSSLSDNQLDAKIRATSNNLDMMPSRASLQERMPHRVADYDELDNELQELRKEKEYRTKNGIKQEDASSLGFKTGDKVTYEDMYGKKTKGTISITNGHVRIESENGSVMSGGSVEDYQRVHKLKKQ